MITGHQVITPHGGRVDLLAVDRDGNLVVVELKRGEMPRDIVTQVLDYGSRVQTLRAEDIAPFFNEYRKKRFPNEPDLSIDAAFCRRFGLKSMPEELTSATSWSSLGQYSTGTLNGVRLSECSGASSQSYTGRIPCMSADARTFMTACGLAL